MIKPDQDIKSCDDLPILDPKRIKLFRHGNAELRMTIDGDRTYLRVTAARAFPLSEPEHYVSIIDVDGSEIGLFCDLAKLGHETLRLVEEELQKRYFMPIISFIHNIKSEFGTIYWDVETDKGPRQFVVRNLRESVFEVSPNRYLIQDVDGNRFEVRDASALDKRSRSSLERLL